MRGIRFKILKDFRSVLSRSIQQKHLSKFKLALKQVERDLRASKKLNRKLFRGIQKLTDLNKRLEIRCEVLEQRVAKIETRSLLDVPMPVEVQDLITDFESYEYQAMSVQGGEDGQNVKTEIGTKAEVPEIQGLAQFFGDPNPPPPVLVTPDDHPFPPEVLEFSTLVEPTSSLASPLSPSATAELEEYLNDICQPDNHHDDSDLGHGDSASGSEENQLDSPSPPPKNADLWKVPHYLDPSDPSGLTCSCGFQRPDKKPVSEHIRYYTEKWKFHCKLCKKSFPRLNILRKHRETYHPDQISSGRGTVGCRTCGEEFPSRKEHKWHLAFCR